MGIELPSTPFGNGPNINPPKSENKLFFSLQLVFSANGQVKTNNSLLGPRTYVP